MCFTNDIDKLNEFRARKKAITVWKSGVVEDKTGVVSTHWGDELSRVRWIKGTVVKPSRIRQPLRRRGTCSAGLYFYTSETSPLLGYTYGGRKKALIIARVKPKDIIAVDCDGRQICCVAAEVIEAPNPPDQRIPRLKWLDNIIATAREEGREREETKRRWLEEQEEKAECLEQMVAEANGLRADLKGSKRASKSR